MKQRIMKTKVRVRTCAMTPNGTKMRSDTRYAPNPASFKATELGGPDIHYSLAGFIQHFGTHSWNGHYVARVKDAHGWAKHNDEMVTREGDELVFEDGEQETVYMLFLNFQHQNA